MIRRCSKYRVLLSIVIICLLIPSWYLQLQIAPSLHDVHAATEDDHDHPNALRTIANPSSPLHPSPSPSPLQEDFSTSKRTTSLLAPSYQSIPYPYIRNTTESIWAYPTADQVSKNDTHAIALLSMGPGAAQSTLIERSLLSIRKRGQFLGPILVLTDAPLKRFEHLTTRDPNLVIMHPLSGDWRWSLKEDMPYKRFKTYILEYLVRDDRLHSVEYVYYLDLDVAVGRDLRSWFNHVETTYLTPHVTDGTKFESQIVFFEGNYQYPLQGGQFVLQRGSSQACLELWRHYIDAQPDEPKDQKALERILKEVQHKSRSNATPECHLTSMPQQPHLTFVTSSNIKKFIHDDDDENSNSSTINYPTLLHIKNTQDPTHIPGPKKKRKFFQQLLGLPPEVIKDILGNERRIRPDRTWSKNQISTLHLGR